MSHCLSTSVDGEQTVGRATVDIKRELIIPTATTVAGGEG